MLPSDSQRSTSSGMVAAAGSGGAPQTGQSLGKYLLGRRLGEGLLEAQPDVSAIVAANDVLAAGAMRAIKARGRRVPDDMAVIGFDDFEFAAYLEPPLTTVKLAGLEMGRKAAQMLLRYTAEGSFDEKEVTFPATLVARASA